MNFPASWFQASTEEQSHVQPAQTKFTLVCSVVVFFVLAGVLTRDEFLYPNTLPLKSTKVATVPLFNSWTIGWNADRLRHGLDGYWNAPIFHPTENTFAFSEPQPATMLVAPFVWMTGSVFIGYKLWMLLSLALNGFLTSVLLKRLGYARFQQLVGGIAIMLLPIIHQRIDVLQLVPVWGILWFWSSLFQLVKHPNARTVIETGLAFAMCFGLCVHHGLFLTLLLPFAGVVFVPALTNRKFAAAAFLAVGIASLMVLPIVLPIRKAADSNKFARSEDLVKRLSATPRQYLVSQKNSLTQIDYFKGPDWRQLNVGWIRMGLAGVGLIYGLISGRRRRWILFLALTGLFAFAFSLGLNLDIFGWKPWQFLCQNLPGFGQVRSVYRFVWFVQMAIVLLAVESLVGLHALSCKWFHSRYRKLALACLVIFPGTVLACEVLPEPTSRGGIPQIDEHSQWINFVRENSGAGKSIACLPFATGTDVEDYDVSTRWMLYGLQHGIPIVNGYSGFFPQGYIALRDWMNAKFPNSRVLNDFVAFDVELIIVAENYCTPDKMLDLTTDTISVELVFEDPVGMNIYRITKAE